MIESQLFGDAGGVDEIMAAVFVDLGATGLRQLLALSELSKDDLAANADKLRLAGLEPAADVLLEGLPDAPDRVVVCPYIEADAPHYGFWQSQYAGTVGPQGGRLIYEGEESSSAACIR